MDTKGKEMVEDFIRKFNQIYSQIIDDKGLVNVFVVLKMDDFIDKWTVILNAPWTNIEDHNSSFIYLLNVIRTHLSIEEQSKIARVGIFESNNHFIKLLTESFRVENGPVVIKDTQINGNLVHEAYIFRSTKSQNENANIQTRLNI